MDRLCTLGKKIAKLNIFDTETNDDDEQRKQIISTRVYLFLLTSLLIVFILFTSLPYHSNIITMPTPTLRQYEQLAQSFSSSLRCPCKSISIPYEKFISINPVYHEICSSDFVTQRWIDYLFYQNTSYYFQLDFRHSASGEFQLLRTLCQHAKTTVDDSLRQFYLTRYITNQLVAAEGLEIEANSSIELFQITTPSLFISSLRLIREAIKGNRIFSGIETLFFLELGDDWQEEVYIKNIYYSETRTFGKDFGCVCNDEFECQIQQGAYADITQYDYAGSYWIGRQPTGAVSAINATILLPGLFAGCLPIESVMRSTSECWFEQSCLDTIGTYINFSAIPIGSFTKLNASRFELSTTFEDIQNQVFIERWIIDKSYRQYFNECQPLFCQYTDEHRRTFAYVMAATISLYGGLRAVLTFLVPILIGFLMRKKNEQEKAADVASSKGKFFVLIWETQKICGF